MANKRAFTLECALQMLEKLKAIAKDLLEREIIIPPPLSWNACGDDDEDEDGKPRNFFFNAEDNDERRFTEEGREEVLAVSRMSFLISAYEPRFWWFELFGAPPLDLNPNSFAIVA